MEVSTQFYLHTHTHARRHTNCMFLHCSKPYIKDADCVKKLPFVVSELAIFNRRQEGKPRVLTDKADMEYTMEQCVWKMVGLTVLLWGG